LIIGAKSLGADSRLELDDNFAGHELYLWRRWFWRVSGMGYD
jgi:hypothetical protein